MYVKIKRRKLRNRKTGEYTTDKNYTAIIRFPGGFEFSRSTGQTSKRAAEAWAKREAARIEAEELPKKTGENITLNHLFGWWWSSYAHKQRSSYDMKNIAKIISDMIGPDFLVKEIDDDFVADFTTDLFEGIRKERSASRVNRILDILRAALREGRKNKIWREKRDQFQEIFWSDHKQKEPRERTVFLSPQEARELMSYIPKHIALAVAWSIYTGCRLNETQTLVLKNVYREARYCEVFAKGGHYRNVMLSQIALNIIDEALKDKNTRNPIWMHGVFNLENRRKFWEAGRAQLGRPDLRWHDLRHVGATWLRQYGNLELNAVSKALGHSTVGVTQRYAHVADDELIRAYDALPDVMDFEKT